MKNRDHLSALTAVLLLLTLGASYFVGHDPAYKTLNVTTSGPETSVTSTTNPLSTPDTSNPDLEGSDWFLGVVQSIPSINDADRKSFPLVPDKNGCYSPQNVLGTPSKGAPTIPPPPSTSPPLDKPIGTLEYGKDCGPGSLKWRLKTGDIVSSSASFSKDGSTLYIGSRDGSLYALRTSDGTVLWKTAPEHAVDVIPAVEDDMVVYGSSSARLTAVKPADGSKLWSFDAGDGVFQSSPLIVGDRVFSGGGGHFVRSFNRSSGALVWEKPMGMWVQSSVVHKDGVVYIGSDAGFLVAFEAKSGKELWKFAAHMPGEPNEETSVTADPKITPDGHRSNILSTPRFSGDTIYITSIAGMIYAVDSKTGKEQWSFLGERIVTDTTVSDGVLYTHSDMGILRAFDAKTGKVLWGAKTGTSQNYWPGPYQTASAPAVFKNQVLVGGTDGDLSSYDTATGRLNWSFRTGDWIMSSPRVSDSVSFFGSNDGWIYAVNLD